MALFFEGVVCQTLDLKGLSCSEEASESVLVHLQKRLEGVYGVYLVLTAVCVTSMAGAKG